MMYAYLKSIQSLWLHILECIDCDSDNISFIIYDYLNKSNTLISKNDIIILYPTINSLSCQKLLCNIHRIIQVIEEYIKRKSNIYTFFRLSNIVKIKENVKIDKYFELYDVYKIDPDDDQSLDPNFEIHDNNIKTLMESFYTKKIEIFEKSYEKILNQI